MMGKRESIVDIIDLEYLQAIQDALGRIVGITTVLLDPQGVPLSEPTNLHAFCLLMQESEHGQPMCLKANEKLIEHNLETREPTVITCPNSGLKTAAVPIFLGDRFLGSWIIGQIRMEDVDEELIMRTAQKAGISHDEAKKNISNLPMISQQEFDNVLSFLTTISQTVTDLVEMNEVLDKRNSELEKLTDRLDRSLYTFKSFIDFSDVGACLIDYQTYEVIMCNDTYKRLFGINEQEVSDASGFALWGFGVSCSSGVHRELRQIDLVDEKGMPTGPHSWETYNESTEQWLGATSRVIQWINDRLVIVTTFLDITERKMEEERISYLAYNDQRLNIFNDVKLHKDITEEENESYLVCFDIQGLRKINDVYGRDAGDHLLHSIVDWIKTLSDEGIELYRIEGGGFVLSAQTNSEEQVMALAKRIAGRFETAWVVDMEGIRQKIYTGAHIGVIKAPETLGTLSDFLNLFERVISFARKESDLILFDEKMNKDLEAHIQFEIELKSCVLNDMQGFYLNYQPIVDINENRWVGLEALCRWEGPTQGLVSPVVFIAEAERLGLIDILSGWVMNEAIRQAKEWKLDEVPGFVLDINLSPIQLRDRELTSKVQAILEKYDFPAQCISLEITETSEVHFEDMTMTTLEELKSLGVSLSLDDFGSGYATFSNLNNLPIDCLKTDRSFVIGIEHDDFLQQTVRSLIELARAAGLTTIAEGVETEEQLRIMEENGISKVQGYYYSKPLSVEVLSGMLDRFAL